MSMIKDMKTYLIARGVSEHIFLGSIPDGEDECIGLYRYAGAPPVLEAGIERLGLQVRCRAASYEDAVADCNLVAKILTEIGDEVNGMGEAVTIDGTKYIRVYPNSSSESLGSDANGMHEVVQNFTVNVLINNG